MNVLDLFSGIGGFSLGLERAGMRTVAFCESDPFCRKVLAKHWPGVPCYDDVRTLTAGRLRTDGIAVDVIAGGFPCQDISHAAGARATGIDGKRSGLWSEFARIIGEVRPRYVIVENVAALLGRGIERVCGDLAALLYDCEGHTIPASAIGAPHVRERVWIVAHANGQRQCVGALDAEMASLSSLAADTAGGRLAQRQRLLTRRQIADAAASASGQWDDLPDVGRAVHGIPNRVDRLRSLGNAVVPQIPELIGRAIMRLQP